MTQLIPALYASIKDVEGAIKGYEFEHEYIGAFSDHGECATLNYRGDELLYSAEAWVLSFGVLLGLNGDNSLTARLISEDEYDNLI